MLNAYLDNLIESIKHPASSKYSSSLKEAVLLYFPISALSTESKYFCFFIMFERNYTKT